MTPGSSPAWLPARVTRPPHTARTNRRPRHGGRFKGAALHRPPPHPPAGAVRGPGAPRGPPACRPLPRKRPHRGGSGGRPGKFVGLGAGPGGGWGGSRDRRLRGAASLRQRLPAGEPRAGRRGQRRCRRTAGTGGREPARGTRLERSTRCQIHDPSFSGPPCKHFYSSYQMGSV